MMVPPLPAPPTGVLPAPFVECDRSWHSSLADGRGYQDRVGDVCVAPSLNKDGYQTFETLAADPVRRLPDHNQRIADCVIIKSAHGPWSAPCGLFAAQHPHGVLAMKTGVRHELLATSVSLTHRTATASSSRVAMVTRLIPASAPQYQSRAN
jgi:hypothetical protein